MKTHFNRPHLWTLPALSVLFCIIMIVSCSKTESTSAPAAAPANTQLNADLTNSTNFVVQAGNLDREDFADMISSENAGISSDAHGTPDDGGCRTITYRPSANVYPHTKTIVADNCTKCDGSTVNGTKIITYYVDPAQAKPGDLLSVKTYRNFRIDDEKVMGTVSTYLVSNDPYTLRVVAEKTIIEPGSDGGKKTYTSELTWTRISGGNTATDNDDVYAITGTTTGTEILHGSGLVSNFTSVIDPNDPLINSNDCCWNTQGTVTASITVKSHGGYNLNETLDFGDGTCDDQATLTVNGKSSTVTLPLPFFPLDNGD